MLKLSIVLFSISTSLFFLTGCDQEIFGYDFSVKPTQQSLQNTSQACPPIESREDKLRRVYDVITVGDSIQLITETMGKPDSKSSKEGAMIKTDVYEWKTPYSTYHVTFVYGRVKDKSFSTHPTTQP